MPPIPNPWGETETLWLAKIIMRNQGHYIDKLIMFCRRFHISVGVIWRTRVDNARSALKEWMYCLSKMMLRE